MTDQPDRNAPDLERSTSPLSVLSNAVDWVDRTRPGFVFHRFVTRALKVIDVLVTIAALVGGAVAIHTLLHWQGWL